MLNDSDSPSTFNIHNSTFLTSVVRKFLRDHGIPPSHLLVALSGGFDSTALALAVAPLAAEGYVVSAGHVNHHLRGTESDQDETYVRQVCTTFGIELHVADAELDEEAVRHTGIEAAARTRRYAELRRFQEKAGAAWVLTAHNKNDVAETLLFRFLTRSGPGALAGIAPVTHDRIARPFLSVTRAQIERELASSGVAPRTDSSNASDRFPRNRIRHELLPLVQSFNPRVIETLAETATLQREQNAAFQQLIASIGAAAVERHDDRSIIAIDRLPQNGYILRAVILREALRLSPGLREIGSGDLRRLEEAVQSEAAADLSRDLEIRSSEGVIIVSRRRAGRGEAADFEAELPIDSSVRVGVPPVVVSARSQWSASPDAVRSASPTRQLIQLTADRPVGAFTVRNRRQGDRFTPLGAAGGKKLKDYLIDRKIDRAERDRMPLVAIGNEIVWIPGYAVSQHFRVRDASEPVIELSIERSDESDIFS